MSIAVVGRISKRFLRSAKFCRMMSSSSVDSGSGSRISPWLMLYPHFKSDDTVYRFHRLKDEQVERLDKRGGGGEVPADASIIVGSSHGWLALFNERNNNLFLSDPLKRRHIKLPRIETLPDPEINLINGRGHVSKLILSCSPDEDEHECRAMMSYGAGDRLAFCQPGRSTHWAPIGELMLDPGDCNQAKVYEDFVYCSKRKLFTCMTPSFRLDASGFTQRCGDYACRWEQWDLSPKVVDCDEFEYWMTAISMPAWADVDRKKLYKCAVQISYLVYAEESDQLYLVVRFVDALPILDEYDDLRNNPYAINDPFVINKKFGGEDFPYETVAFLAFKFDAAANELTSVESLDGLAMFVGINHSFAVSASEFPELNLKPNSIYFTDDGRRFRGPRWLSSKRRYGGLDVGIFDYENNLISPCCNKLPTHDGSSHWIRRPPLWFTPSIVLH